MKRVFYDLESALDAVRAAEILGVEYRLTRSSCVSKSLFGAKIAAEWTLEIDDIYEEDENETNRLTQSGGNYSVKPAETGGYSGGI